MIICSGVIFVKEITEEIYDCYLLSKDSLCFCFLCFDMVKATIGLLVPSMSYQHKVNFLCKKLCKGDFLPEGFFV